MECASTDMSSDSSNREMKEESQQSLRLGNGLSTSNSLTQNRPESMLNRKRKAPSSEEEVVKIEKRMNLDPRSKSSSVSSRPSLLENMKVYVRLKPFPKGVQLSKDQQLLYQVVNPALFINLRDARQDLSKNVDVVGKKFIFSESFGGDVSESRLFQSVVEPQLEKFLGGTSCTVMTYGKEKLILILIVYCIRYTSILLNFHQ